MYTLAFACEYWQAPWECQWVLTSSAGGGRVWGGYIDWSFKESVKTIKNTMHQLKLWTPLISPTSCTNSSSEWENHARWRNNGYRLTISEGGIYYYIVGRNIDSSVSSIVKHFGYWERTMGGEVSNCCTVAINNLLPIYTTYIAGQWWWR